MRLAVAFVSGLLAVSPQGASAGLLAQQEPARQEPAQQEVARQDEAGEVYKPGDGVTTPKIRTEFRPRYSADAMKRRVQGGVKLKCVVRPDGTVTDVRVVEPLDPDLDEAAADAMKKWTFHPGRKGDTPVAVEIEVLMTFSMRR